MTTAAGDKRAAEEHVEPQSPKKARSIDMSALRTQIEYYFSDDNLRRDKFFNSKISSSPEGWLDITLLLSCKKVASMHATAEDIIASISESDLVVSEDQKCIRREAAVPALAVSAEKGKNQFEGGCVISLTEIPAELKWFPIKQELEKMGLKVTYAGNVDSTTHSCVILLSPFEGDVDRCRSLELSVEGSSMKVALLEGDALREAIKRFPSFIIRKRELRAKDAQKARHKAVELGGFSFHNVAAAKKRVSEILKMRKAGSELKEGSQDYILVKAVLAHHPSADTKLENMTGIKVDKSDKGDSHCFWVLKKDAPAEDISVMKCLANLETKLNQE